MNKPPNAAPATPAAPSQDGSDGASGQKEIIATPKAIAVWEKALSASVAAPSEPVQAVAAQELTDHEIYAWAEGYQFSCRGNPHKMAFSRPRFIQAVRTILSHSPAHRAAPAPAPSAPSGPRFTDERPDILNALYAGFRRGDNVERVHFDVVELLKASAPAEAVSVRDAIFKALRGYHMTNMNFSDDEGGGSYTLVDLMTPDCKSIGEGEAEMQILADEIDAAIRALQGKPEAQAGEIGGA